MSDSHTWELRNPDGGMLGTEFARGVAAPTDVMLAHSLPARVTVVVREADERVVARGEDLVGETDAPMARLHVDGEEVRRENVWPDQSDVGRPVILPGGEIGILCEWWHADDHSEWRWKVEFSNHV
ncbi:MAG TPA: hypothetical protein VFT62_06520 [Mycobacteriales bacterium]|nr:hypothetical protein [Mycobacteriales bacterium]